MTFRILFFMALATAPAFGETLLSGAVYFDSENTLLEVKKLVKESNQEGLVRLFDGNHISAKQTSELTIILFSVGPEPDSPAEFRFANNPTTYWTFSRYVKAAPALANVAPAPSPVPSATPTPTPIASVQELLGNSAGNDPALSPSPSPVSTPDLGPLSTPSPRPKPTPSPPNDPPLPSTTPSPPNPALINPSPPPALAKETKEAKEEETEIAKDGKVWRKINGYWYEALSSPSPSPSPSSPRSRRRHRVAKEKAEGDEVPEEYKVWHRDANGHLKWYDKRNLHEVRRAEPADASATPVSQPSPSR